MNSDTCYPLGKVEEAIKYPNIYCKETLLFSLVHNEEWFQESCLTFLELFLMIRQDSHLFSLLVVFLSQNAAWARTRRCVVSLRTTLSLIPRPRIRLLLHENEAKYFRPNLRENDVSGADHTNLFSYKADSFLIRLGPKRPKMLMETTAFDAFFGTVFKGLRLHLYPH